MEVESGAENVLLQQRSEALPPETRLASPPNKMGQLRTEQGGSSNNFRPKRSFRSGPLRLVALILKQRY